METRNVNSKFWTTFLFVENLLQGSIATDRDSRLSWKEDKPDKVRESVIRFAESEKEEEEESGDEDFDKVSITGHFVHYLAAYTNIFVLLYTYICSKFLCSYS